MSKIVIGESGGKDVRIDLHILLSTRLLLTADSGGGKTFALKRFVEQAFGKIQILIIDPEGEFSPLREKLDFVLVGKGGETPADVRSAALVAQTLLKLRACAIVDLYEMKPSERHSYVKAFIDAMIEAPKEMRHPCLVIVDEAHIFCPEHGKGDSIASEAMISLCTRGRKRLLCPVFATQRLATLSKDASSMLLNRMIGPTFEDINRKRAADVLGIAKDAQKEFYKQIQTLEPGNFFCLGRALSKEMLLVRIGAIQTPHGQEALKYEMKPPPAPEKIKALLPSLADLPKEAEEKAKSMADLQKQVRDLKAELSKRPTEVKQVIEEKIVEVPAVKQEQIDELARCVQGLRQMADALTGALGSVRRAPPVQPRKPMIPPPRLQSAPRPVARPAVESNGDLSGPEQKILDQLAELEALGIAEPEKPQLGLMAGYTNVRSGGFSEPMGRLVEMGYATYSRPGYVRLTDTGREHARPVGAPLSTEELHERLCQKLGGPEGKLLREIISIHPDEISKEDLGQRLGYTNVRSGGFSEPVGRLRSLGIIDYPRQGMVRAADWLFVA